MKLRIGGIGANTTNPDGTLSLGCKDSNGRAVTLEFNPHAQEQLFLALSASTASGPTALLGRRLRPKGLSRFQIDDNVGISLLMSHDVAVHVVLHRKLAEALQQLLETFDDPATWDVDGPTRQ